MQDLGFGMQDLVLMKQGSGYRLDLGCRIRVVGPGCGYHTQSLSWGGVNVFNG